MSVSVFKIIELIVELLPHIIKEGMAISNEIHSSDNLDTKITKAVADLVDGAIAIIHDIEPGSKQ